MQWLSRALQDCSGGFVGRLACLLSSHPAQHTTKPKKQLAKTPIDGNVSYLSIAHAPPEALTQRADSEVRSRGFRGQYLPLLRRVDRVACELLLAKGCSRKRSVLAFGGGGESGGDLPNEPAATIEALVAVCVW